MKLELIIDVELDGVDEGVILENLNHVVNNAMGNGLITSDTAATVENWESKVEVIG